MRASRTMRARVTACALQGVEAVPVTVEIVISPGLPNMHIVGMGDSSVQEAKQRVRHAMRAAGFTAPSDRNVVVNLAPASVRKTGSGFDLPIAVAYLLATKQIDPTCVEDAIIVGELELEGHVRPVDGLFACAVCAQRYGLKLLSGQPRSRFPELEGLEHLCMDHLANLRSKSFSPPHKLAIADSDKPPDFRDVVGQGTAVRALTIAAAGAHGLLMVGPPGAGKSMLAARLPSILPPLSEQERIETALVHSVAGLDFTSISEGIRPFRSPHHSATAVALVGGGGLSPVPGEVSLAHNGVLFLDELGEFGSSALQALRQPLEDGYVSLTRAQWRVKFPAHFQLLAASNPCPCGYASDRTRTCKCSESQVKRYQQKLGGPLKDRIDLICEVSRIDPSRVLESGKGTSSAELASTVAAARERAAARGALQPLAGKTPHDVIASCGLGTQQRKLLEEMARRHDLSGRAIVRILQVSRTIADIEQSDTVDQEHLYEAFMFRVENTLE